MTEKDDENTESESNETSGKQSIDSPETKTPREDRRSALKNGGLAAAIVGAGVATDKEWIKPVVNTVMLPAHGQATGGIILAGLLVPGIVENSPEFELLPEKEESIAGSFFEAIFPISPAHAQIVFSTGTGSSGAGVECPENGSCVEVDATPDGFTVTFSNGDIATGIYANTPEGGSANGRATSDNGVEVTFSTNNRFDPTTGTLTLTNCDVSSLLIRARCPL